MKPTNVIHMTLCAGLALALLSCLSGCGGRDRTNAASSPGVTAPGGSALPPQARTAMEAQQQRESADRAAHSAPAH